jgi:hypothetical protein
MQVLSCPRATLSSDGIAKIETEFAANKLKPGRLAGSFGYHKLNVTLKIVFDKLQF